jgi:hypothetical protein
VNGDGAIIGLRRCLHCRYSLTGQPIGHDDEYGLYIVRCPECGTVSPMSEHSVTGAWTRLWTFILGASWTAILVAALGFGSLALFGLCLATTYAGSEDYRDSIRTLWSMSGEAKNVASSTTITINGQTIVMPTAGGSEFADWWAAQDTDALLATEGGWWGVLFKPALLIWIPLGITAFTLGSFWGVVLYRRRGLGLLAWAAIVTGCIAVWSVPAVLDWSGDEVTWYNQAAMSQVALPIMVMSIGVAAVALAAGMMCGRPLARFGVRVTMSPRAQTGLALLWLTDDKPAPRLETTTG